MGMICPHFCWNLPTVGWISCMCPKLLVLSDSLHPYGLQPARLLCPWDPPGKNTGVGCHALFQGILPTQGSNPHLQHFLHCRRILYHWATREVLIIIFVNVNVLVTQSCLTLCDPMDCSPPASSVHGILQARILEWIALPFFRVSSWPRDWTQVSGIADRFFTIWTTRKAPLLSYLQ